jgi:hypothetical protein
VVHWIEGFNFADVERRILAVTAAAERDRPMALCEYCKTVETGWVWIEGRWVSCVAARKADGSLRTAEVKVDKSGRTAKRPVGDPGMPHFPHRHYEGSGREGERTGYECPEWRPSRKSGRTGRGAGAGARKEPMGSVSSEPAYYPPAVAPAMPKGAEIHDAMMGHAEIPLAAPIGVADPTAGVPLDSPEPKVEKARLPEPEELLEPSHMMAWARADKAIRCDVLPTRVLLWGPPGTGKTELPWRIAKQGGWSHVYQLMTEETPGIELLGHLIVQGGSTVWCDGTLGRAIRASQAGPTVLVIDEIARASQDAMSACLLALTNPESLRLVLRSGEVLEPNPANWHVVATSNDDPSMLPGALADRLHIAINLPGPHPDLVRSMKTEEARRLACARSREYSVRALLTYDRLVAAGWTQHEAAGLVWEPSVTKSFLDVVALRAGARR